MKLRHNYLFQLLWLQCLFLQAVAQEDEEEYVRVLVGFHDPEETEQYVRKSQLQAPTASGKPKTKVSYEFQNTDAVAMEVTRAELEEMRKDATFDYIEEDIMVPLAKKNDDDDWWRDEPTRRPTPFPTFRPTPAPTEEIREYESYGIGLTQAYRTFHPDGTWDQQCGVYICSVDSGVFIDNADIPYSRGDGYVDGRSFGLAAGQDWYYPKKGSHGTETAVS